MSLLPSSHFCYLSPLAFYLSILPTHNLFHYVSLILSRSNLLSPSLPFSCLCPFFFSIFCQFPLPLILPLGVRMRAASRSVFSYHRQPLTAVAVTRPWALQMHTQVRVLPKLWGLYSVSPRQLGRTSLFVCLFIIICPLLPRLLIDSPSGSRSGRPLWQLLF